MSLEDLHVTLRASLGATSLSLGEILALEPGSTFSLPARYDDGLALEIDGQTVGRGRAVERSGRLGILVDRVDGAALPGAAAADPSGEDEG